MEGGGRPVSSEIRREAYISDAERGKEKGGGVGEKKTGFVLAFPPPASNPCFHSLYPTAALKRQINEVKNTHQIVFCA